MYGIRLVSLLDPICKFEKILTGDYLLKIIKLEDCIDGVYDMIRSQSGSNLNDLLKQFRRDIRMHQPQLDLVEVREKTFSSLHVFLILFSKLRN